MNASKDLRASERIPIDNRVQVRAKGRMASYALAINISMGGLLLSAAPSLPVGSPCELAIFLSENLEGKKILAEGTVVRSDANGTAIMFATALDKSLYETFTGMKDTGFVGPIFNAYSNYFKASQSDNLLDYERLLGVSRKTFRTVFLTTFSTCIPVAILPVWAFQQSIPPYPNWVKILACFAYGLVWLGLIQPSIDLTVFKFIRNRKQKTSNA